jgi:hypothetical protein
MAFAGESLQVESTRKLSQIANWLGVMDESTPPANIRVDSPICIERSAIPIAVAPEEQAVETVRVKPLNANLMEM